MTDPATLDREALNAAVAEALGWKHVEWMVPHRVSASAALRTRRGVTEALFGVDGFNTRKQITDLTTWAGFGELVAAIYASGGGVEIASLDCEHDGAIDVITVWPAAEQAEADAPEGWPAALARAFLRAHAAQEAEGGGR